MAAPSFEIGKGYAHPQLEVVQGLVVPGGEPARAEGEVRYQQMHIKPYSRPITGEYVPGQTIDTAPYSLSSETLQFYDANGFATLPSLDSDRALAIGEELGELIKGYGKQAAWAGKVQHLHRPYLFSDLVMDYLHSPEFLVPAANLVRTRKVEIHHGKGGIKDPEEEASFFPPHRDDDFYPYETDQVAAITLNLDTVTPDMGPVVAFGGSHRLDLTPTIGLPMDPQFPAEDWTEEAARERGMHIGRFNGEAGAMFVHNARVVHQSAPNRGENPRKTLIIQFMAGETNPDLSRVRPEFRATGGINFKLYPEAGMELARLS